LYIFLKVNATILPQIIMLFIKRFQSLTNFSGTGLVAFTWRQVLPFYRLALKPTLEKILAVPA
jgi:hypothetical protein